MTSVLVVGDERKGGSVPAIDAFADWLRSRVEHVTVVMDREAPLDHHECDLVLVLGGDGSILSAARRMGQNQRPTLGINLGRLGFLTAFGHGQAHEAVELALAGKLCEERRLMLSPRVVGSDDETEPVLCLNDVVLSRPSRAGMVTVTVTRGDLELATYTGDGVIVSTPVGSTAYSLAAGGPLVFPSMDALVLTPLASHTLSARSLVVPIDAGLELHIQEAADTGDCPCIIDGQVALRVRPGQHIRIEPASVSFRHLTRGPGSFFAILRDKFGWAVTARQRVRDLGGIE